MRSTTPSCSPSTPRNTGSSTTRSGRTRPSRGTGPRTCTWAWPTPPSRHFKPRNSCQLLDAGQHTPVTQGALVDLQLPGNLGNRTIRLDHQLHGYAFELFTELTAVSRHGFILPSKRRPPEP